MAYGEYNQVINNHLSKFEAPKILEIGIETAIITMPMLNYLGNNKDIKGFSYYGVDIYFRDYIKDAINNIKYIQDPSNVSINVIEQSSLNALPQFVKDKLKFDLILVDGDHNYYTVIKELRLIKWLLHDDTMIVVDDYRGPWATLDYWYSEAEAYVDNTLATKRLDTAKQGVKPAVDEWLIENPEMELFTLINNDNKFELVEAIDFDNLNHACLGVLIKKRKDNGKSTLNG